MKQHKKYAHGAVTAAFADTCEIADELSVVTI